MHSLIAVWAAKFLDPLLFLPSLYVAVLAYKEKSSFRFVLLLCLVIAALHEYLMSLERATGGFSVIKLMIGVCASLAQVYALIGLKKLKNKSSDFFDKKRKS